MIRAYRHDRRHTVVSVGGATASSGGDGGGEPPTGGDPVDISAMQTRLYVIVNDNPQ